MNKGSILAIGVGRAGNVLLNELLNKDKRYVGLFVNTAYGDLEGLDKLDKDKNAYIFSGVSGTGRNREVAKEILKDRVQSLAETIAKYPTQNTILLFFSLDGGSGSGISPTLCSVLKRLSPDKSINVIGVLPDIRKIDKLGLNNTINCWNDLMKAYNANCIDSIMLIDNSKRKTYTEINQEAISTIDNAMNMNGKCDFGSIDDSDIRRTLLAKGYTWILKMNDDCEHTQNAITTAIAKSVFAKPDSYICDYLAVSVKDYDVMELSNAFEYEETKYLANNNSHNTIVLGGCDFPSEALEDIKNAYEEAVNKKSQRNRNKVITIDLDSNESKKEKVEPKVQEPTQMTSEQLDNLFEDLF